MDITPQRLHHEIYLSDPRKADVSKLKTVLRHPIKLPYCKGVTNLCHFASNLGEQRRIYHIINTSTLGWRENMEDIKRLLQLLGATGNYRCFARTIAAMALVMEDENRLFSVIQEVYAVVGRQYGCTWQAVEHSLRTTIGMIWRRNPELLIQIAGYQMEHPPTASEFMEVVSNYLPRERQTLS